MNRRELLNELYRLQRLYDEGKTEVSDRIRELECLLWKNCEEDETSLLGGTKTYAKNNKK